MEDPDAQLEVPFDPKTLHVRLRHCKGHRWEWCRTVENLIPETLLIEAVKEVHPKKAKEAFGALGNPYNQPVNCAGEDKFEFSKVAVAKLVAQRLQRSDVDDGLAGLVTALSEDIRAANGLQVRP